MSAGRLRAIPRDEEGFRLTAPLEEVALSVGRSAAVLRREGLAVCEAGGRPMVREADFIDRANEAVDRAEADAAHGGDRWA